MKCNLGEKKHTLTVAEQSAGGKASGRVRAARKTFKEEFLQIFDENPELKKKLCEKFINEMIKAKNSRQHFETLRDTIGEKPIEQVQEIQPPKIIDDI